VLVLKDARREKVGGVILKKSSLVYCTKLYACISLSLSHSLAGSVPPPLLLCDFFSADFLFSFSSPRCSCTAWQGICPPRQVPTCSGAHRGSTRVDRRGMGPRRPRGHARPTDRPPAVPRSSCSRRRSRSRAGRARGRPRVAGACSGRPVISVKDGTGEGR
jgi:hypothetical protein